MKRVWLTIRGYVAWSYDRGSLQYDVMVTLILLFVFLAPHWINFNDKPIGHSLAETGVVVYPDGPSGFVYEIDATAVQSGQSGDDDALRQQLQHAIEPVAGEAEITGYQAVRDSRGRVRAYRVRVRR